MILIAERQEYINRLLNRINSGYCHEGTNGYLMLSISNIIETGDNPSLLLNDTLHEMNECAMTSSSRMQQLDIERYVLLFRKYQTDSSVFKANCERTRELVRKENRFVVHDKPSFERNFATEMACDKNRKRENSANELIAGYRATITAQMKTAYDIEDEPAKKRPKQKATMFAREISKNEMTDSAFGQSWHKTRS